MNFKMIFIIAAKLLIVSAIFYYLITNGIVNLNVLTILYKNPVLVGFVIFVIICISNVLVSIRWKILLLILDIRLSFARLYGINWISQFFATVLPGTASMDLVKAFYVINEKKNIAPKSLCLSSIIVDRLLGFFGILIIASAGILLNYSAVIVDSRFQILSTSILVLVVCVGIIFGIILFPFYEKTDLIFKLVSRLPFNKLFEKIYRALRAYEGQAAPLCFCLILSVFVQLAIIVSFIAISYAMNQTNASFPIFLFIIPIGEVSTVVPLAPGGIGVGHVAFDLLYESAGLVGGADVFNVFTVIRLSLGLMGVFPYLIYSKNTELKSVVNKIAQKA
jgi:glycosyltransferase 2 family protein